MQYLEDVRETLSNKINQVRCGEVTEKVKIDKSFIRGNGRSFGSWEIEYLFWESGEIKSGVIIMDMPKGK